MTLSLPAPRASTPLVGTHPRGEEPMQLGGTRLTPAERRRRRLTSDTSLYCGQAGHFYASCLVRPKGRVRQPIVGVLESLASACPE